MDNFFGLYWNLLEGNDISPPRIWNMDETELRTVLTPKRVITVKGKLSTCIGNMTGAERGILISTSMLCVCNAAVVFLPPIYIFPNKRMTHALMNGAAPQAVGYASSSGYVDWDLKSAFKSVTDDCMVNNSGHPIKIHQMARLYGAAFLRYLYVQSHILRIFAHFCMLLTSSYSRYTNYIVELIETLGVTDPIRKEFYE